MSKYGKEIALGFLPVLLAFLMFVGVNPIPVLLIGVIGGSLYFMTRMRSGGGFGVGERSKSKAKLPSFLTFEDIGGQERAKKELIEALDFLVKPEQIQKFGIRPLKGILLMGPPGTGKTLMAKAAAHYTDSVFVGASGSEFVEMYVGVGASRVRDMFKEARQKAIKENKANAIIFIDEIDVVGGKRDGGQQREYDQTLNQLLTEMDGLHTSDTPRILVMAATNRKDMLDSALLRPGRFDRHIGVDLPDAKGRLSILDLHARNKPLDADVSLQKIADQTFGFSGAQLESLMNEGAIYAMREELDSIRERHLLMAIDKVMMGEKTDREAAAEERERVAIHELGHAIVAETVRSGSVSQVALSPRGQALGYVRHNPPADKYLYTMQYLEEQIMIAIAGSAAEEMFYGERSTGSRNDFEQALGLVRTMIDSGLTELGIVDSKMLTKEEYNKANGDILASLTERTRELLAGRRDVFERSLDILKREETLSGDRFRDLLHSDSLKPTA
ncbi:AAA family ATPase [Paenibacillus sp.]|uniref:AAA family ATPase n=1 Tax=Paenibacillus sp. TaxID=58172 RepID=UPI002D637ADA|nr:AAA family ATPase [Paenibacillus sp.]HZG55084.1 AAA family ATPase [Paenibacillus sp.]